MAILWDAPLASAVADELSKRLAGARLRSFFLDQPARNLLLFLREATVVFRLHPLHGEVTLHETVEDLPADARPLQANLRGVAAPADERLLVFRFAPVRSGREPVEIVVELLPNRWNALVVEARSRIIRHVLLPGGSGGRAGARELLSGARYEAPEPSGREGADGTLALERWLDVLLPVEPSERRRALLGTFAWTASLNAPALLGSAGETDDAGDARTALTKGWALWKELASGATRPCVMETPRGPHPYPLPLPHLASSPSATLLEAFATAAAAEGGSPRSALVPSDLLGRLEEGVRHAEKRVRQLEAELERAPDAAPIRAIGDLILARFGELPKGRSTARLTGFDGEPVDVALDPSLPPHRNAERYYDEAARAERAREIVPGLIRKAEERAEELRALLRRVRGDDDSEDGATVDLAQLRDFVESRLPRRRSQGKRGGGRQDAPLLPYHVFRSSGGLEIRVGRGPGANDDLTFHHSSPDDIWLHARQVGGAHVILRWSSDDNPPARDLYEAGVLAALNSKARTAGSAPVDWTRRKYVRKPRKAAPGAVLPTRVGTIFVEPDPALAKRLAVE